MSYDEERKEIKKKMIKNKAYLGHGNVNHFEIALRDAMSKPQGRWDCDIQDLQSGKVSKGYLTDGQESHVGDIGVEYHNRWCFYLMGKHGRIFLRDFTREDISKNKKYYLSVSLDVTGNYHDAIIDAMIKCNGFI